MASRDAVFILAIPYMFLMLNLTADSLFYGTGNMAFQSMIVNFLVFGTAFIFYKLNICLNISSFVLAACYLAKKLRGDD